MTPPTLRVVKDGDGGGDKPTCRLCGRSGKPSSFVTDNKGMRCKAEKACAKRAAPKRNGRTNHNQRKVDEGLERAATVLKLRREGWRQDAIAQALGITQGRVSQIVSEHYAKLAADTAEEAEHLRALELERIDHLYEQLAPFAIRQPLFHIESGQPILYADGTAAEGPPSLQAIDTLRKLSESRRKLLGLDAPAEVKHTGKVEHHHAPLEPDKAAEVYKVLAEVGAFGAYKPTKAKASRN